jgi:hypothetical protein
MVAYVLRDYTGLLDLVYRAAHADRHRRIEQACVVVTRRGKRRPMRRRDWQRLMEEPPKARD